ncbi:nucleoside deaminase [Georgenia subflava]|uniref:Nucleoside deaminase n=1 Tax=Georgenia subflava TaxID=1622177 RepID=A0A6N7EKY3_9MICO|nr:nucleoside deaminase [Georgenia subflava]MPV38730.1 nucleoside deaminase [Georgenia subflava]
MTHHDHHAEEHLARAVELATRNVGDDGGPFAAIVVTADGRRFEGSNRVTATLDPTAHAEIVAIRTACSELGVPDLDGATLYSSCEPCPMCLSAALWARIEAVYYAADRHDAAEVGFDDAEFHRYVSDHADRAIMPLVELRPDNATAPFEAWSAYDGRQHY